MPSRHSTEHFIEINPRSFLAHIDRRHGFQGRQINDFDRAWFGSNPSVPAACDGASEVFGTEGCKTNGLENFERIAFWRFDMSGVRDFLLINNTDSLYSYTIPVQYPKTGTTNSSGRVGVGGVAGCVAASG